MLTLRYMLIIDCLTWLCLLLTKLCPKLWDNFLTCGLGTCVLNWWRRLLNVWLVLWWPFAADGTLKSKNYWFSYCCVVFCLFGCLFFKDRRKGSFFCNFAVVYKVKAYTKTCVRTHMHACMRSHTDTHTHTHTHTLLKHISVNMSMSL